MSRALKFLMFIYFVVFLTTGAFMVLIVNADENSVPWIGLLAPARTPRSRIDKVLADSRHVLADRDVRAQLINQGFLINDGSPEDFAAFIRSETTKWGKLVKQSGAKID